MAQQPWPRWGYALSKYRNLVRVDRDRRRITLREREGPVSHQMKRQDPGSRLRPRQVPKLRLIRDADGPGFGVSIMQENAARDPEVSESIIERQAGHGEQVGMLQSFQQ